MIKRQTIIITNKGIPVHRITWIKIATRRRLDLCLSGKLSTGCLLAICTQLYPATKMNSGGGLAGRLRRVMKRQEDTPWKRQMKESGKMREGGTDESIKGKMTKCGRWEQGERQGDRRGGGQHGGQLGWGHRGSSSGSQSHAFICRCSKRNFNQLKRNPPKTAGWSNFPSSSLLF